MNDIFWNIHWAEGSLKADTVLGLVQYLAYTNVLSECISNRILYELPL